MEKNNFNSIDGGFLQSPQWEKFQNEVGRKTFRINEGSLMCLAIENKLPIVGNYLFIPRGPLKIQNLELKDQNRNLEIKTLFSRLIEIAKNDDIGWIRIEPQSFSDLKEIKNILNGKFKIIKSKKDHEPVQTLMVDLSQGAEEILAAMKSKTRYNIKLSKKKGIKFYHSKETDKMEFFMDLMEETAKRDKIVNHPKDYYKKMLEVISDKNIELILAKFNGKVIAGAIMVFNNEVVTYLHGASSDKMRNLMASFGVQWEAIRIAKGKGYKKYDFGGVSIATEKYPNPKKNWTGITRFKAGFCPNNVPVEFPGCWDIILNSKRYFFYRVLQWTKDIVT